MSAFDSIENLLQPKLLKDLKGSMAPVRCKIWTGPEADAYEDLELDGLYPFDTLDTLKSMIAFSREPANQEKFFPKHTFVGFLKGELLEPLDYIWNETGTSSAAHTTRLPMPTVPLSAIPEFDVPEGEKPLIEANARGRSTIEDIFSDVADIPTLYVYTAEDLINANSEAIELTQTNWYKYFYPYFPIDKVLDVIEATNGSNSYLTEEDKTFFKTLLSYIA